MKETVMEQDWNCPHCGKKIGTLTITPEAAANPATFSYTVHATAVPALITNNASANVK